VYGRRRGSAVEVVAADPVYAALAPDSVDEAAFATALVTDDIASCAAATGLGALAKSTKSV